MGRGKGKVRGRVPGGYREGWLRTSTPGKNNIHILSAI